MGVGLFGGEKRGREGGSLGGWGDRGRGWWGWSGGSQWLRRDRLSLNLVADGMESSLAAPPNSKFRYPPGTEF